MLLSEAAEVASSTPERMKGLLGRDRMDKGEAMVITPCSSVHTFWMRFPIDVLFYDRRNRIIALLHGLRPWRVSGWHPLAAGVVELPAGTLAEHSVAVGDELEFA